LKFRRFDMKLKKVGTFCSREKIFELMDQSDDNGVVVQWLGDGGGFYPMYGLPVLDEEGIYRMFDVSEKARDKTYFHHGQINPVLNVNDFDPSEVEAVDAGVTISYGGRVLLPLYYPGGVLFIQTKYLEPVEDKADYMGLYVRRMANGGEYVVVKVGMLVTGVIMPMEITDENFVQRLETVAELTRRALEKRRSVATGDPAQNSLFQVDEETGEVIGE
jgi:hypothetical protein